MKSSDITRPIVLIAALILFASSGALFAQESNQITAVDPDTAERGTSSLLVSFTLDSDVPPPPPAGALPNSATIGTMGGSSITHDSQYTVTALFDIPGDELTGAKDCSVVFTTPQGELSFSLAGGFTVTATDAPPTVTEHPQSQTVTLGESVSFTVAATGTDPLAYQWQKDGGDIGGETGTSLTFAAVAESDGGDYRCVVDNVYGADTSNEATLTVDISVQTVIAPFPVIDTMQDACFDDLSGMACPSSGQAFYGQDAQFDGYQPQYEGIVVGSDQMVVDHTTGLTWEKTTDINGDGVIGADDKLSFSDALNRPVALNAAAFGGYTDWRLPTIKEMYSLMDFRGEDPSGETGDDTSGLTPFIDNTVFDYNWGDTAAGERIIDSQYASTNLYVSTEVEETMFGVNFADGRIKGYGTSIMGSDKTFYVQCVRGNPSYGVNDFSDNADGTVTDLATGLMWDQNDNGTAELWADALIWVENRNAEGYLGYDDWRLPNAKELQSILDYTRSPYTHGTAAIDPVFNSTAITSEPCVTDYPWYWSSTTHASSNGTGGSAAYVCFGRSLGYMNSQWVDIHGAGAQRSDPKDGDMTGYTFQDCGYYFATAPQGDAVRSGDYVRLVRGGSGPLRADFSWDLKLPTDLDTITFSGSGSGGTSPYSFSWDLDGSPASGDTAQTVFAAGTHTVILTVTDAAGLETTVTREVTVTADAADAIFADGFESGDTTLWSISVP